MKSASHHAMGYLLITALEQEGVLLDREQFVLGNLLPDYLPELILAPHFTMKCQREIGLFTGVLAAQRVSAKAELPADYSLRLGILCHYITDYFCFAHSREFQQNLAHHSSYEQALDSYFRDHYTTEECLLPAAANLEARSAKEAAQAELQQIQSRQMKVLRVGLALHISKWLLPALYCDPVFQKMKTKSKADHS